MTLPTSGPISLSAIQSEFGGSNPISASEYYRGGSFLTPWTVGTNGTLPASGAISFGQFYGSAKYRQETFLGPATFYWPVPNIPDVPSGVTQLYEVSVQGSNGSARVVSEDYNFYGFIYNNTPSVLVENLNITTWDAFFTYVLFTAMDWAEVEGDRAFVFWPSRYGLNPNAGSNSVWRSYIGYGVDYPIYITGPANPLIYWELPLSGSVTNMNNYSNFGGPGPNGAWFGVVADRVLSFGSSGASATMSIPGYGTVTSTGGTPENPTSYPDQRFGVPVTPGSTITISLDGDFTSASIQY